MYKSCDKIISEMTDEDLIKYLRQHLENAAGVMPENVRLMALEVLRRWIIRQAGE